MSHFASNEVGSFGEAVAVSFLERHGVRVVATNVFVDRDEIDIIYRGPEGLVAVEVKTSAEGGEPFDALTESKMRKLRRAVSGYGEPIVAIDAVGVAITGEGTQVRWLRGI